MQEQLNQFLEIVSEKGYKVEPQPNLADPSRWRIVFTGADPSLLREQLPQYVMKAGLTLVDGTWGIVS